MGGPSKSERLSEQVEGFKTGKADLLKRISSNKNITDESRQEFLKSINSLQPKGGGGFDLSMKEFSGLNEKIAAIDEKFKQAENPEAGSVFDRRQQVKRFLDTVRQKPGRRQLTASR